MQGESDSPEGLSLHDPCTLLSHGKGRDGTAAGCWKTLHTPFPLENTVSFLASSNRSEAMRSLLGRGDPNNLLDTFFLVVLPTLIS